MTTPSGMSRGERWTRRTEYPLAGAAMPFLVAYAWPILNPNMPHLLKRSCDFVVYIVWALFALDYLTRLLLAENRARFVWRNFSDALWWAATTVMTVGNGDRYPVTLTGRLVAVGLMIGGISLLGVVTASIAAWLLARVRDVETSTEDHINRRLDELHAEISERHRRSRYPIPCLEISP